MAKFKQVIESTTVVGAYETARSEIESLKEEIESWRDNIEESFGETEKFEQVSECADALEALVENLPDETSIEFGDYPLEVSQMRAPPSRRGGLPRWARLSNALVMLEACKGAAESVLESTQEFLDELESVEGDGIEFPSMFG
jgi:hypothetical protein